MLSQIYVHVRQRPLYLYRKNIHIFNYHNMAIVHTSLAYCNDYMHSYLLLISDRSLWPANVSRTYSSGGGENRNPHRIAQATLTEVEKAARTYLR